MPDTEKPDLKYRCPTCGQDAVLGQHFCATVPPSPGTAAPKPATSGYRSWLYPAAGAFLLTALLWRWLGPASLVASGVTVGALVLLTQGRKTGGAAYRELVALCKDKATAERLIEGEVKRKPGLTRSAAARRALERYRRDLTR